MKICLTLSLVCLGGVLATPRVRRDVCVAAQTNYDACVASAHAEHQLAISGGDDGRADWYSRKSCNFIQAAVMDCGDLLIGDCFPEESIQEMRNQQFESIVASLEQSEEWDSQKCDSVNQWKDQMAGNGEEDADNDEVEDNAEDDAADNDDDNDGVEDDAADNDDDNDGVEDDAADEDADAADAEDADADADADADDAAADGEGETDDDGDGEADNDEDGDGEADNDDDSDDGNADSSAVSIFTCIPLLIVASLH